MKKQGALSAMFSLSAFGTVATLGGKAGPAGTPKAVATSKLKETLNFQGGHAALFSCGRTGAE